MIARPDYNVTYQPALCSVLLQDGLITTLKDVYVLLQDALDCNSEIFREVTIVKPGLRAVGGAFDSRIHGDSLYVTLGSAVFPDYSVFIPSSEDQVVKMALPNPALSPDTLFVILSRDTEDSHPYDHKAALGTVSSVDVVTRDTAKLEIVDGVGSDTLVICELYKTDEGWTHQNVSALHRLETTSSRLTEGFVSGVIGDFTVRSTCTVQMKPNNHTLNGSVVAIDHEGNIAGESSGAVLYMSWTAPRPEVEGRRGNIAYYKVRAVPRNSAEQLVPAQALDAEVFHHYDIDGDTVRLAMPCSNGTWYDISLYELDDTLSQIVNGPIATATAIGGIYDNSITPTVFPELSVKISQPFTAKNVLKIRPTIQNSILGPYVCQVFVREYIYPTAIPTTIADRPSLIYEGPASTIYHVIAPDHPYCLVEVRAIQWMGNKLICHDVPSLITWSNVGLPSELNREIIVNVCANNVMPDSAALSTTIATWQDTPSLNISRVVCSMPQGSNLDGELMWGNTTPDVLIASGGDIVLLSDGDPIVLATFDSTGFVQEVFDPMLPIPASATLELVVSHDTDPCLPYMMSISLYIDDGWGWADASL